jgi:hypothetical protein
MAGRDLATVVSTPRPTSGPNPSSPVRPRTNAGPPKPSTSSPTTSASSATSCAGSQHRLPRHRRPGLTPAEDVLALKPDGVFLSNGPGDPEPLSSRIAHSPQADRQAPDLRHLPRPPGCWPGARRQDLQAEVRPPRRNHPVLNKITNKVEITSQNHGFAVDPDSLNPATSN